MKALQRLLPVYLAWPCCLLCLAAGCGSWHTGVRAIGTVSYEGRPVEEGQIVFFPIDGTRGPSTGGAIVGGRFDLPARIGPRAGGVYRVEVTAMGAEHKYSPSASGKGGSVTVREQMIPPHYNQQSTLRVTIPADTDQFQHDFDLD